MPFRTVCPACATAYHLEDEVEGKKVRCRECQEPFRARSRVPEGLRARTEGYSRPPARPAVGSVARGGEPDHDGPGQANPQRSALPWVLGGLAALAVVLVLLTAVGAMFLLRPGKDRQAGAVAVSAPGTVAAEAPAANWDDPAPKRQEPAAQVEEPKRAAEPRAPRGQLSALALRNLKGATVFIKVEAGRLSCTGSGFLCKVDGDTGYLVTNHHVVNPEAELLQPVRVRRGRTIETSVRVVKYKPKDVRISAVFHSGTRQERVLNAEVLATDESRDLAVLRVKGGGDWPRPITPNEEVKPIETMQVYILGFPFGEALALKKGNPAITINKGSVSSLRENDYGQSKAVQIDGAINPGNSGGPVVDEDGHLLGVAVATVRGSGIGLAIAPDELTRMFQGRAGGLAMKAKKINAGAAEYEVDMHLIDPMGQIRSVSILYKAAAAPAPRLEPKPDGTFDPLDGAQRVDLKVGDQQATGSLKVERSGATGFLVFQTCYVNGSGKAFYTQVSSKPIGAPSVSPSGRRLP